jgi:hypothetical protein
MAITSELIKSVTADLYNRSLRIMIASGEPTVMGPEEFAAYVKTYSGNPKDWTWPKGK